MCLAVPMKLVEKKANRGVVEAGGIRREVGLEMVSGAALGDYLIIHAGFAIQILDEKEALETLALFEEMERLA